MVDFSVALLLVTYYRPKLLDSLLFEIGNFNWSYLDFVIIDNGSETSTKEILEYHKERLKPTILCLKENIGHGAGLAKGMKYLKENRPNLDYVVFLEDDSIPKSKYLNFLISKIKATDFSMISSAGSIIKLGKRIKIQSNHKDIEDADFALFDGAIARFQDLLRVGFPIQDWFMMFDDFEYCYRIRKNTT